MKELLNLVSPHLSPDLVSPLALSDIQTLAKNLPPYSVAGFECRLGAGQPQVDFQIQLLPERPINLPEMLLKSSQWQILQDFFQDWVEPKSFLHQRIKDACLEFDLNQQPSQIFIPSVFLGFNDKSIMNSPEMIETVIRLCRSQVNSLIESNLQLCAGSLPDGARISHLGVMLSRSTDAVRVNVMGIPSEQLVNYLKKIGWKDNKNILSSLVSTVSNFVDYILLSFDIGDKILPRIGLECFIQNQYQCYSKWQVFLEHLVEKGLCTPAKKNSILEWTGMSHQAYHSDLTSQSPTLDDVLLGFDILRAIHHVKIVYQPGNPLEAKGYLFFGERKIYYPFQNQSTFWGEIKAHKPSQNSSITINNRASSKVSETDNQPEIQLLLSCARLHIDTATAERICNLLQKDLNWDYIIWKAKQHKIMPLLYSSLKNPFSEAVPQAILAQLRTHFHANEIRNQFLTQKLLSLLNLFEKHSIPVIPFKGPVLATSVYGKLALRQFDDLDILVHNQDIQKAKKLLISFISEDGRVNIDLHRAITPKFFSFSLDFDDLWERLQPVSLAGTSVLNLSPEDSLLVLCVYLVRNCWQKQERLIQICDIAELLRAHQEIDWKLLLQQATQPGSKRMLFLGLFLAHTLLESALPEEIWQKIQADSVVKSLALEVREWLFSEADTQNLGLGRKIFYERVRERLQDIFLTNPT